MKSYFLLDVETFCHGERKERISAGDSMRANDEVWSKRLLLAVSDGTDNKNGFSYSGLNAAECRLTHNSVDDKHRDA